MATVETVREVFAANQQFYEAFERLDIRRMTAVWCQDDDVQCIHPGWPRLTGWRAVRDSWIRIFNNTRSMAFRISDTRVTVHGAVAWVVCVEWITMVIDEEPQETRVLATNIFRRRDDQDQNNPWLMVLHHGSPVLQQLAELEEQGDQ
jgi:ketosteroid isomerase-like protein